MQTIQLRDALITVPAGSTVQVTPKSYVQGERMVTYVAGTVSFTIPQRAVMEDNFLAAQLSNRLADVNTTEDIARVNLTDSPIFNDSYIFSLIIDFLTRRLKEPATLRTTDLSLTREQWASLVELECFIFHEADRNPFWTGRKDDDFLVDGNTSIKFVFRPVYSLRITPDELNVTGPNGFALTVNLERLTNPPTRPVSLVAGEFYGQYMEFPFDCNFKTSFFIPHTAIRCFIDGRATVCEGVIHSNGTLHVEPIGVRDSKGTLHINTEAFQWFHFHIIPRFLPPSEMVYGDPEPMIAHDDME